MRTTIVLFVLALCAAGAAAAGRASTPSWTHARPLTPTARDLLAEASHRSAIVTAMLNTLEKTDIIVYLSDSMSGSDDEPRAYLAFLTHAAGIRYLLVRIDPRDALEAEGIALLAHELQHALEVARAPEVQDAASMAALYRRIGWESHKRQFESERALSVGSRVWYELTGRVR